MRELNRDGYQADLALIWSQLMPWRISYELWCKQGGSYPANQTRCHIKYHQYLYNTHTHTQAHPHIHEHPSKTDFIYKSHPHTQITMVSYDEAVQMVRLQPE